ncbi:MAG: DUF3999 family protein [Steroidobacteraceae bacterium]
MIFRRMFAGLLSLLATVAAPGATCGTTAAWSAPLQLAGAGPAYQVNLPLHVYRNTVAAGRADLRVTNAAGEVVPYALLGGALPGAPVEPTQRAVPFFPLRGDAARGVAALRLSVHGTDGTLVVASGGTRHGRALIGYLFDTRQLEAPVSGWTLQWEDPPADFDVTAWLQSNDDLLNWEPVAVSVLADLHQGERRFVRREIRIVARQARYWRLSWDAPAAPMVLRSATVRAGAAAAPPREALVVTAAAVAGRAGEFSVELPGELPIDQLNVCLPAVNTVAAATFESRPRGCGSVASGRAPDLYRVAPSKAGAAEIRNWRCAHRHRYRPARRQRIEPASAVAGHRRTVARPRGSRAHCCSWRAARRPTRSSTAMRRRSLAPCRPTHRWPACGPPTVPRRTYRPRRSAPPGRRRWRRPARAAAAPFPWKRWILWGVLIVGSAAAARDGLAARAFRRLRSSGATQHGTHVPEVARARNRFRWLSRW